MTGRRLARSKREGPGSRPSPAGHGLLPPPEAIGGRGGRTSGSVRAAVLPLGVARRPGRPGRARRLRRRPRALQPRPPACPGRHARAGLQPALRERRLAVDPHRGGDRLRRHAVSRRLRLDGAQPARLRRPPDHPPGDARAPRRRREAARGPPARRVGRGRRGGVGDPRRGGAPHRARGARGDRAAAAARDRGGPRRRRGLAGDAPTRARARRGAGRQPAAGRRRGRGRGARVPHLARGPQLHLPGLSRVRAGRRRGRAEARRRARLGPRDPAPGRRLRELAGLRQPAARGARPRARALPAEPDQGELARHGAPRRLPRLRGRQALRRRGPRDRRAPLPRPLHTPRLPRQPGHRPDPAPQGGGGARARGLSEGQPQREGAHGDPRDLSARRAVPDHSRRAVRAGDRDPAPGRAPAAAAVRAPGHLRPLRVLPGVRAARPLQHREPPSHRGDHPARHRRAQPRLLHARVGVGARAAALPGLRGARPAAGRGPGRDRDAARGRHPFLGRRPAGGAARRARRGARLRALPPLRRRLPHRLPRRLGAALRPGRHPPDRGAERRGRARAHPLPPARGTDRAAAREGLPRRRAAGALGHPAAVREPRRGRGRRAALLDHPARPRLGLAL